MSTLTEKQLAFARHKADGLTHKAAAIAAGYSAPAAEVTATKLMQHPEVKKMLAKLRRDAKNGTQDAESDTEGAVKPVLKDSYPNSLALLQDLYNNPRASMGVRVEAAKLALPYEHGKVGETGKKKTAAEGAKEATIGGRFAQKRGPGRPATRGLN